MYNNKYVACLNCGVIYDTEEYYYLFEEEEEDAYSPCDCNVYFYKDRNGFACCRKNEEKEDK